MSPCPTCGAEIAADAPAGLCPACLLRDAPLAGGDAQARIEAEMRAALRAHAPELELGARIGRGGTGLVFRGRQRGEREVAVKVLFPALGAQPAFAERFAREAEALARLAHPNIVAVYDHGRAGELFYLVLEHVDGVNLRQALAWGPLAPERALALVTQLCEALAFAHEQGIVHRDIKPENVLLDRAERAKIADFGLAKLLGADAAQANLTSTGVAMGTLRYMAPEQLERPLEVDHRADIYSLGVVFYEMLTGEIPMGRFALPSQRVRVDAQLDEVVLHMLDREPALRYQSASEVKGDVEAIGSGRPRRSTRAPRPEPRRFSWLAALSCALAIGWAMCATIGLLLIAFQVHEEQGAGGTTWYPTARSLFSWIVIGLGSLLSMALSSTLARAATDRIRSGWPQLYGVGAALTGAWLVPLFTLNWTLGLALARPTLARGEFVSPGWAALFFATCMAFDIGWIARRRRRFLAELAAQSDEAAGRL